MKWAGTIWAVVTRLGLDEPQRLGGVPLGHDDDGAALGERHLGVGGRGHVVAGAAHQMDVAGDAVPRTRRRGSAAPSRHGGGAARVMPLGRPVVPEV